MRVKTTWIDRNNAVAITFFSRELTFNTLALLGFLWVCIILEENIRGMEILFVCLSLSLYASACLSFMYVCLSIFPSIYLSVCQSICPYIYLSIYLSILLYSFSVITGKAKCPDGKALRKSVVHMELEEKKYITMEN